MNNFQHRLDELQTLVLALPESGGVSMGQIANTLHGFAALSKAAEGRVLNGMSLPRFVANTLNVFALYLGAGEGTRRVYLASMIRDINHLDFMVEYAPRAFRS